MKRPHTRRSEEQPATIFVFLEGRDVAVRIADQSEAHRSGPRIQQGEDLPRRFIDNLIRSRTEPLGATCAPVETSHLIRKHGALGLDAVGKNDFERVALDL